MSRTRVKSSDIQDLSISAEDIAADSISNDKIIGIDAVKLTGTIDGARFPAALPAIDGSALTNLPTVGDDTVSLIKLNTTNLGTQGQLLSINSSQLTFIDAPNSLEEHSVWDVNLALTGTFPAWDASNLINIPQEQLSSLPLGGVLYGSISNAQFVNSSITTNKIADNNVTAEKIAANAVGSNEIDDNSVSEQHIANNSITTNKIVAENVTTLKIADNAITTNKILDLNVTTLKIADNAITTNKILDNNVTNSKIESLDTSKLTGVFPTSKTVFFGFKTVGTSLVVETSEDSSDTFVDSDYTDTLLAASNTSFSINSNGHLEITLT